MQSLRCFASENISGIGDFNSTIDCHNVRARIFMRVRIFSLCFLVVRQVRISMPVGRTATHRRTRPSYSRVRVEALPECTQCSGPGAVRAGRGPPAARCSRCTGAHGRCHPRPGFPTRDLARDDAVPLSPRPPRPPPTPRRRPRCLYAACAELRARVHGSSLSRDLLQDKARALAAGDAPLSQQP